MSASLEGRNPRFRPDNLAAAHARVCKADLARIEANLSKAFDPVVNVINSESILFDKSDVGSRLIEAFTLPRDCHVLFHSPESTSEFAQKIWQSLTLVSW